MINNTVELENIYGNDLHILIIKDNVLAYFCLSSSDMATVHRRRASRVPPSAEPRASIRIPWTQNAVSKCRQTLGDGFLVKYMSTLAVLLFLFAFTMRFL